MNCIDFPDESTHPFYRNIGISFTSSLFVWCQSTPQRQPGQLMTNLTIWHNPRCSKSRMALSLLEEQGARPTQVKYLETRPTKAQIREVLRLLGIPAIDLVRRGESTFRELSLSSTTAESELISVMASHPVLIERPFIITETKAVIGRPTENTLTPLS